MPMEEFSLPRDIGPEDQLDVYLILRVLGSIFPDEFQFHQLKKLIRIRYAIKHSVHVLQSLLVADGCQSGESIPLASVITLAVQKRL